VTSELLDRVQHAWFLSDGALLISGARRSRTGVEFGLVRRDAAGHERMLWRGDAWIAGGVPLDDRRAVISTLSFQFRLGLFEPP
jgi:hypothetical protein